MSRSIQCLGDDWAASRRAFVLDCLAGRFLPIVLSFAALALAHGVPIENMPDMECAFLALSGYPCPLCGMTRSFWAAARADLRWAFNNSPLGALMYPAAWMVFIYNVLSVSTELITGRRIRVSAAVRRTLWIVAGAALAGNWIYRLAMGLR